jgi:hypothetical protein
MKARYQTSKKENGETSHEVVCECELMHWQLEFPSYGAAMSYIAALDSAKFVSGSASYGGVTVKANLRGYSDGGNT